MPRRVLPSPRAALAVLTGLNFLNYVDRFIPAAVMPSIIAALHLKDSQAGSLSTLFILSYSLISPVAGWLADRKPRFQLAAVGVFVWSLATFGSGLAPTFLALVVARALTGVGEASYVVITPSLVSDYYPPARRGRALAIFYAAIPVGSALGYVLGGAINARFGWRWAFFLAGAPGAALAFALLFLRDPPRGGMDIGEATGVASSDGPGHAAPSSAPAPPSPPSLGALLRIPSFLFNTAAQIIYTFVVGGLATWMPTYFVRVRHLPLASADLMFGGVLAAAGLVGTLIGGRVGDRLAARHPSGHFLLAGASLLLSVPFAVAGIVAPSPAIFWPAMFVALTLLFLNTGPLNAAMANVLPAQLRGWGFAMNTMAIHLLGDAASPTVIGFASDRIGLKLPVLVMVTLPFLAGLVLLAGRSALTRDLAKSGVQ
jgi:MFS family permease